MCAQFTFTSWSENAIREARRQAQAALDRGETEYLGLDQADLAAAIRDLDRFANQCIDGRYRGNLPQDIFTRVIPLITDANARLPRSRRRPPSA